MEQGKAGSEGQQNGLVGPGSVRTTSCFRRCRSSSWSLLPCCLTVCVEWKWKLFEFWFKSTVSSYVDQIEVFKSRNRELRELFQSGFGVHHAGMLRSDRNLTGRLFSEGLIKVIESRDTCWYCFSATFGCCQGICSGDLIMWRHEMTCQVRGVSNGASEFLIFFSRGWNMKGGAHC